MDGCADGQAYRIGLDVATDRVSAVESRVPPEAGNRDQRKAVVTANRANVGGHIMRVGCRLMAMSGGTGARPSRPIYPQNAVDK